MHEKAKSWRDHVMLILAGSEHCGVIINLSETLKISAAWKSCFDHFCLSLDTFYVVCEFFSVTSAGLNVNVALFPRPNILNGLAATRTTWKSFNGEVFPPEKERRVVGIQWTRERHKKLAKNISIRFGAKCASPTNSLDDAHTKSAFMKNVRFLLCKINERESPAPVSDGNFSNQSAVHFPRGGF